MVTRIPRVLLAIAAVVAGGACHGDGQALHGCATSYSSGWTGHGLDLEHTLPEKCPVFLSTPGLIQRTGATVVDGGTAEFYESYLNVRDFSGDPVGLKYQFFGSDASGRWVAPIFAEYQAGRDALSPDKATFRLTYLPNGTPGPDATMHVTYTNAVIANVSGPGTILVGSSQTFTADVTAGQAPFTYQWYRDWELVGTGQSYTGTFDVGGQVDLRLDVIDARGEVDSGAKSVIVSSCMDGSRTC